MTESVMAPNSVLERQIDLELKMINTGIARYRKSFNSRKERNGLASHESGQSLMMSVLNPFIKAIQDWIDNPEADGTHGNRDKMHQLVEDLDAERLGYLAMTKVINGIANSTKLVPLATSIGVDLELEVRLRVWLEEDEMMAKMIIEKANKKSTERHKKAGLIFKMNKDGVFDPAWVDIDKTKLGLKLVDLLIVSTGIVEVVNQTSGLKTYACLRAAAGTLEWIENYNTHREVARPRFSPCIVPPKDWEDISGGGWHNKILRPLSVIKNY